MISNNFNNKLKASKSPRDLDEVNEDLRTDSKVFDEGEEDREETLNINSDDNPSYKNQLPSIVINNKERLDNRHKPRPRQRDEFPMARGGFGSRRGFNIRGRGGGGSSYRKMERENELPRSKFQESLSKDSSSESGFSSSTKYYNDNERIKNKFDFGYMVPEDSRISKLLRRLCREDDSEKSISLCKQLQESLMVQENGRYIRRSLDLIAESLLDMLHSGPGPEVKYQAAQCLGRVGYVLEQDFKRYMDWIFTKYSEERNDEVRMLLMKALLETLQLEAESPKLEEFSTALMKQLQSALEYTEHPEMLMGTVDVIIALQEIYPCTFTQYFRDTVDILVGWHIDGSQPPTVMRHASRSLQKLRSYWIADLQFSVTLLSQFVEDMEVCMDDLEKTIDRSSSPGGDLPLPQDTVTRLTKLITVFNTVVKILGQNLNPSLSLTVGWTFLTECFTKILTTVIKALSHVLWEDLIIVANECSCLLLAYLQSRTSVANGHLYDLINMQLDLVEQLSDCALISMLRLIGKAVREVSANLPLELVQKLLGPSSAMLSLRFSPSVAVQDEVVAVYHCLLNLKNIPLLQEAYRYVLGDLEIAYKLVVSSVDELCTQNPHQSTQYRVRDAELVIMIHLRALADLANASNSIIGMWALKPSILELLAVKLLPYHSQLADFSPVLQYTLLYLLYSHCSRYNHFVSSSALVSTKQSRTRVRDVLGLPATLGPEVPTTSPSSGHLSIILKLLSRMLTQELPEETTELVLQWTREVFLQAHPYMKILHQTVEFEGLVEAVVGAGHCSNPVVVLWIVDNLEQLLEIRDIPLKQSLFSLIVDLCLIHINSTNLRVKFKVCHLLTYIPWHITMEKFVTAAYSRPQSKKKLLHELLPLSLNTVVAAQRHHLSRGSCGEMQPQHFRKFMGYLLQGQFYRGEWLLDLFHSCWPVQLSCVSDDDLATSVFGKLSAAFDSVLLLWAVWEAAQLCVMYKLRTPLGKPQETFTSIEGAIKNLARELTGDDTPTQPTSTSLPLEEHVGTWEQRRVRLLLEFLEQLEKTTHNASEGCATALLPAPKPVRTFFHTNKSTCAEWLSRIRGAVIVVALHVGHATTAVRHGHYLLQDLLSNNNTQGTEFEKAVMYVGWALCKLQEPEAIQGLYVWSKEVTGRKFLWLKAATEQAAGRFESSAESYCKLLSTQENSQSEENYVLGFMADQLIECYKAVNNWKELQRWKEKENEMFANQNGGVLSKYILNTMTADHAKALSYFEDGNISLAAELAKWPTDDEISDLSKLDDKIGMNSKSWSSHKLIRDAQHILFNIAITMAAEENFGINNVDRSLVRLGKIMECQLISQCHMQESVRNGSSEFLLQALVMQYSASGLNNILLKKPAEAANTMFQLEDELTVNHASSSTLSEVLWWSKYFGTLTVDSSVQRNIDNLSLNVARAARKEGNLGMAQRFLLKCFSRGESCSNLEELAQSLIRNNAECGPWRIKTYTEVAKLLYSLEKQETAVQVCCLAALNGTDIVKERCSRLLLTLAKWLQHQPQLANKDEPLAKLMFTRDVTLFIEHSLAVKNGTQVIPASDLLVGQLLQSGVSRCPTLAKSWNQLASWCYRWGRRVVDAAIEAGGQLSEADRLAIQHVLPAGTSREDLDRVYAILSQTRAVADEEDIETEDFNTSEMIESQLQSVGALSGATSDQLCYLVDIWRSAQKRVYSYYELSAMAYFKYLELCGEGEHMSKTGECTTITATLRLLRLIVKHALELQSVLESGFASTPTRPWKAIIPQLFSRLSHPEAYVRRRVSELLCRVTEDAPHLITFPAVVGAATCGARLRASSTTRLFNTCLSQGSEEANGDSGEDEEEENEDEDDEEDSGQVSVLKTCFLAMVDTLSKQAPEAISQVQLLVQELRRITLLWDELWLGTLVQHHAEISRRLAQLDTEVARVEDNVSLSPTDKEILIAEKHRIILKPLVFILEQLHSITSVSPETPHEKFFQEKFGESIAESLQKLKSPINPRRPQESWQPLKQLQARLQQRSQKRAAYSIRMQDVSPALARLSNTVIAMPGVSSVSGKIITIASVDNNIAVLPTKTKPKKLMFHGSDGQIYTYLFKGLEDLHLDERIMQFLNIANTMMWRNGSSGAVYRARHYSVIPLGPRSGLISWVDGVVPLFGLYKRWQQREATSLLLKGQSSSSAQPSSTGAGQVMRPSELFYSKLTPLLKEQGITDLDNRKEWPLPILKQVLTQLMEETPKDLLAKELWCHSVNAGLWWQSTRTYSYSVAVMSIIGYIIGLGDRHLDNVLVDLTTGEVVHIDYNVSFEKGKTLRVPEKVPFRMTPNIKAALGVTGVEGIFRLACEHVLKVMKKGRETLLTLLEAFVYDPLIDWTPGNEAGYTGAVYGGGQAIAMETKQSRKEVEREVTQAMFCVRVAEMKAEWMANRDEILSAMPELFVHLNKWLEVQGLIRSSEESLQDCHQQMALLKEAEASPQHPLYTLADRYSKHCRSRDASEKVRVALKEKIEDCDKHLNLHKVALSSVRGPQLAQWMAELNYPVDKDSHLVFDLVKEFLQNAGKGQMITQCEQSECELGQISQQQVMLVRSCLDLLSQYGTVASMYPASYLASHRSVCYRTWAQRLLNNMSTKSCHEVVAQFQTLFSPKAVASKQQQVITVTYQLQAALADANARLQKSFERLKVEGLSDSGARLEAAYNDAKVNISKFLCEEKGAALALECVNITALCALNKRYLMMEAAAASAGDCLVDLTSRDGDWFLDEMYLASSLVTELSNLLPLQNQFDVLGSNPVLDSRVDLVLQCLKSAHTIYKGLQELNFNFHTIILPEAVKTIQQEEPTVCFMMQELDDIIQAVGCPLTDLLARLEMHLRYIIMEMDSPHVGCQLVVASLQAQFNSLLQRTADLGGPDDREEALTPGQMLLMGFNGLFEKLHLDGNALIAALETLETPSCWKKVDQVREAKAMLAPVFNEATRGVLEDIFLIKRLQTMQEFFMLCNQTTRGIGAAYDDDHLNKPIRRFTADYVSRQLLGVTSQTLGLALCLLLQRIGLNVTVEVELRDVGAESKVALEELCHKAVDLCMKRGMFTTGTLAQASGLTSNLEATWRRREGASHLQHEVEARRSTLQRLQLQLTAHHWLHEDTLLLQAATPLPPLSRPSFMLELRKTSSALLSLQPRLSEARQQQSALVSSVEQRLKWAAGANPALSEVMAAFDTSVSVRAERLNLEQGLAALVGNTCTALLHHEALRTRTSEALAHDTAFLQLLEQCEKTCQLAVGCDQSVTPQEESLVQMLVPEGPINHVWIQTVEVLISDRIKSLQQQILGLQESLYMAQDCAKNQAMVLRSRLAAHHKLMADVRNLLKSMVKFEECGLVGVHDYLVSYRAYADQFTTLIRDIVNEDLDTEKVHAALTSSEELKQKTMSIYQDLLELSARQQSAGGEGGRLKRPPLIRQDSICFSPRRGLNRDPHTGKAVQERNAYALSVWRRVRMKLEGRDPDPGRRATVQEQVDHVIEEAMSLDNLALLYEGWTPWV